MKYLIFIIPLLLFACSDGKVEFIEKEIADQFSIEVPNYMDELDLDNPGAALQMGSELKEHYVTVVVENTADLEHDNQRMDLSQYAFYYLTFLQNGLVNPKVEPLHVGIKVTNGLQMMGYKVVGLVKNDNLELASYVMFYRSGDAFYYVSTWTLASREPKLADYMKKIVYSLKEL